MYLYSTTVGKENTKLPVCLLLPGKLFWPNRSEIRHFTCPRQQISFGTAKAAFQITFFDVLRSLAEGQRVNQDTMNGLAQAATALMTTNA